MPLLFVLACIFEALLYRISLGVDLREHVVETIILLILAGVIYLILCFIAFEQTNSNKSRRFVWYGLAASVVFRLTVWPVFPSLTDDPFRYRWLRPLTGSRWKSIPVARPIDPRYVGLRDSAFDRIPGKDFLAVYGPLTEQLELWTYRAISWFTSNPIRQVFWFKVPYALCDLGVIAALWF